MDKIYFCDKCNNEKPCELKALEGVSLPVICPFQFPAVDVAHWHQDVKWIDRTKQAGSISLDTMANRICKHLPESCIVGLMFENGSAWVEVTDSAGNTDPIDGADQTLYEQLNEAISKAKGFPV